MQYPLNLSFKIIAFAPQVKVTDSLGSVQLYIRQKIMAWKTKINVFSDEHQNNLEYYIERNKVFAWAPEFIFTDKSGQEIGKVKRLGSLSALWNTRYDIYQGEQVVMTIREQNPMIKVIDTLVSAIPFGAFVSAFAFHPSYIVETAHNKAQVMKVTKKPAFFEGKFELEQLSKMDPEHEKLSLLSLLVMTMLERRKG